MSDRDLRLRAAEKLLRVGKLDAALAGYQDVLDAYPDDHATAVIIAGLLYRTGRADDAIAQFTKAADALATCGDVDRAADVYRRILAVQPHHEHALEQSARIAAERNDFAEACTRLVALAGLRATRGNPAGALEALGQASLLAPDDLRVAAQIARIHLAEGDAAAAAPYLTGEMAGNDPDSRLAIAEILCRGGRYDEGLDLIERTVADHPACLTEAGALAGAIAAHSPDRGQRAITLVADSLCAESRFADAAAALDAFVTRMPACTDAIVRLVEVSVDGGLNDVAERAQARLANAYLETGAIPNAVAILEDLASRHPDRPQYVSDLRQALVLAGESDPDTVLRQRLALV
jgi:tetratricopeptide (TPR) repeat protein